MFERFTDRARTVIIQAQEEARLLNHNYIGTEHILLGLIREEDGVAAVALGRKGLTLDKARDFLLHIDKKGASPIIGHIPFTIRAKKVIELAMRETLRLGHNYIGTEHILLALIREGEGKGAQILAIAGVGQNDLRQEVLNMLSGSDAVPEDPNVTPGTVLVGRNLQGGYVLVPEGAEITRITMTVRFPGSKQKHRFEQNWEPAPNN
jgi:ATP-dependent Clp protease ATP-binding subunit ClpC